MSKQLKCCKQTSALDVATQWACAELLQRWVLYHNYRIINTPPPSQEGLYRMHDAGCREDQGGGGGGEGKWGGVLTGTPVGSDEGWGWELVQCN